MSTARNFVLFKTDLFLFHQHDEDIDRWHVGGDCAAWFYVRLLLGSRIKPALEPVMEDWGWTFEVVALNQRVRVNVWAYFEIDHCWIFGVDAIPSFGHRRPTEEARESVCEALEKILLADARFLKHKWFDRNPWELLLKSF
jgi:hypothetical protein